MRASAAQSPRQRLRILCVEDSPDDVELTIRQLERAGYACDWTRVYSATAFLEKLGERFDVILADYSLPGFDGLSALRLLRERDGDTPFILISGAIGEERAIESLKAGATDYVLKDRLDRLVPVVERALSEREQRASRRRAESELLASRAQQDRLEQRLVATIDALPAHIAVLDRDGAIVAVNDAWKRFAAANAYRGKAAGAGRNYLDVCDAAGGASLEEGRAAATGIRAVLSGKLSQFTMEYACHGPSERRWFHMVVSPSDHRPAEGAVVMHLDVTDRRAAEVALRYRADLESLLMRTSRRFVDCKPGEVEQVIDDSLSRIGWFLGVDWAFLLLVSPDRSTVSVTHEWCAPGFATRREEYRASRAETELWSSPAPWLEPLVVDHVDSLRIEMAAEKALLQSAGVRSAVLVPMLYGSSLIGMLGFASIAEAMEWSPEELPLLKVLAEVFVSAFVRQRDALALLSQADADAVIARFVEDLIRGLGGGDTLRRLCRATTEALRCDMSHTFLRDEGADAFRCIAGFGETDDERQKSRRIVLAQDSIAALLKRLEIGDTVAETGIEADEHGLPPHRPGHRLCMALWRGTELIGIQIASRPADAEPFRASDVRIGERIARLASLALEHARVLEELERSNRLKSNFVANMSHELRTPLNIVLGYNELMLSGAFGELNPEQTRYAKRIQASASQLLHLVDQTLDLGRIERGTTESTLARVDLRQLVTRAVEEVRPAAAAAKLALRTRLPRTPVVLETDAAKLERIVRNLLSNAIQFTEVGSVCVTLSRKKDEVAVAVADTGPGIRPDVLPKIFDAFSQVEDSLVRSQGGVGLGLSIARRLAALLGGSLEARSEVGRGSTFTLRLPMRAGES